jgi:acetylornithine deacetylase
MIRVPSITPWFEPDPELSQEDGVQEIIAGRMEALGAEVERWEPDPEALSEYEERPGYYADHEFEGRPNQAAVLRGGGEGRSLLLTGHVDVVPPGEGWTTDPFGGERRDGRIYGRGAVDMKGGIAAMVGAVEAVVRSGVELVGDVTIGTVVDEEAGGMGTLALVAKGYRADACILTESTNMKVAPLCRGILWGEVKVPGRSGHIELPQGDWREGGAVDAIGRARMLMDQIDRLNEDWALRKRHPLLPLPCQVYIAKVEAGEHPTTYADRAELTFNAQYLPEEKDDRGLGSRVKGEIEAFVGRVAEVDPWLREHPPVVEWLIDADCAETPADHPFVQLCAANLREVGRAGELEGVSAHTDMGWFVNVGIPTVNFGPGEAHVAHQNDENVPEADLLDATRTIALTLLDWCGTKEE